MYGENHPNPLTTITSRYPTYRVGGYVFETVRRSVASVLTRNRFDFVRFASYDAICIMSSVPAVVPRRVRAGHSPTVVPNRMPLETDRGCMNRPKSDQAISEYIVYVRVARFVANDCRFQIAGTIMHCSYLTCVMIVVCTVQRSNHVPKRKCRQFRLKKHTHTHTQYSARLFIKKKKYILR